MDPLDHLPQPLQWFRGDTGSVVFHWLLCMSATVVAHKRGDHAWQVYLVASGLLVGYLMRELWKDENDVDSFIKDMLGPVANYLYVLALV